MCFYLVIPIQRPDVEMIEVEPDMYVSNNAPGTSANTNQTPESRLDTVATSSGMDFANGCDSDDDVCYRALDQYGTFDSVDEKCSRALDAYEQMVCLTGRDDFVNIAIDFLFLCAVLKINLRMIIFYFCI